MNLTKFGALKGEKVQEKNQETKKDGGIGFKNFWNYIKASDTLFMFFLWIILKLGSVSLFVLSDLQYSKIGDVVEGKNFENFKIVQESSSKWIVLKVKNRAKVTGPSRSGRS